MTLRPLLPLLAMAANALPAQIAPRALETFVDSVITAELAREKMPAAAFVFVQNGRAFLD